MQIAGPHLQGPDSVSLMRTGIPKRRVCPRDANVADWGLSFTDSASFKSSAHPHTPSL